MQHSEESPTSARTNSNNCERNILRHAAVASLRALMLVASSVLTLQVASASEGKGSASMTGMHTTLCSGGSTIPAGPAIGAVPFDGPDIADAAGNFPPDCTIAAGPQNLLVAVNG